MIVRYVPETNTSSKLGTYAIYVKYLTCMYRWCMQMHMPHVKSLAPTIWQGVLYTYLTYFTEQIWMPHPNIAQMANMLNGHIYPILLHRYTKTQPTAVSTSPVIAKYVLERNMPTKLDTCAIYAKNLTCIYEWYMYMYVPHMKHVH